MGIVVEVAVDSIAGVVAAEQGGASRIELCASLPEGGVTPGVGTMEAARAATSLPVFVMIRPRGGDFVYSQAEQGAMIRDIEAAKGAGADGVVLGLLGPDGSIDSETTRQLVTAARPLPVTFHRAIDVTPDKPAAVRTLMDIGIDRILTSGGAERAEDGLESIRMMVAAARERTVVMPGSGVNAANAARIVAHTGAREIHLSAGSPAETSPDAHRTRLFGPDPRQTDSRIVRAVVDALSEA